MSVAAGSLLGPESHPDEATGLPGLLEWLTPRKACGPPTRTRNANERTPGHTPELPTKPRRFRSAGPTPRTTADPPVEASPQPVLLPAGSSVLPPTSAGGLTMRDDRTQARAMLDLWDKHAKDLSTTGARLREETEELDSAVPAEIPMRPSVTPTAVPARLSAASTATSVASSDVELGEAPDFNKMQSILCMSSTLLQAQHRQVGLFLAETASFLADRCRERKRLLDAICVDLQRWSSDASSSLDVVTRALVGGGTHLVTMQRRVAYLEQELRQAEHSVGYLGGELAQSTAEARELRQTVKHNERRFLEVIGRKALRAKNLLKIQRLWRTKAAGTIRVRQLQTACARHLQRLYRGACARARTRPMFEVYRERTAAQVVLSGCIRRFLALRRFKRLLELLSSQTEAVIVLQCWARQRQAIKARRREAEGQAHRLELERIQAEIVSVLGAIKKIEELSDEKPEDKPGDKSKANKGTAAVAATDELEGEEGEDEDTLSEPEEEELEPDALIMVQRLQMVQDRLQAIEAMTRMTRDLLKSRERTLTLMRAGRDPGRHRRRGHGGGSGGGGRGMGRAMSRKGGASRASFGGRSRASFSRTNLAGRKSKARMSQVGFGSSQSKARMSQVGFGSSSASRGQMSRVGFGSGASRASFGSQASFGGMESQASFGGMESQASFGRASQASFGRASQASFGRASQASFGRASQASFGRASQASFGTSASRAQFDGGSGAGGGAGGGNPYRRTRGGGGRPPKDLTNLHKQRLARLHETARGEKLVDLVFEETKHGLDVLKRMFDTSQTTKVPEQPPEELSVMAWLKALGCRALAERVALFDSITKRDPPHPRWFDQLIGRTYRALLPETFPMIPGKGRMQNATHTRNMHIPFEWVSLVVQAPFPTLGSSPPVALLSPALLHVIEDGLRGAVPLDFVPCGFLCVDPAELLQRHLLQAHGLPQIVDQTIADMVAFASGGNSKLQPESKLFCRLMETSTPSPALPLAVLIRCLLAELRLIVNPEGFKESERARARAREEALAIEHKRRKRATTTNGEDKDGGSTGAVPNGNKGKKKKKTAEPAQKPEVTTALEAALREMGSRPLDEQGNLLNPELDGDCDAAEGDVDVQQAATMEDAGEAAITAVPDPVTNAPAAPAPATGPSLNELGGFGTPMTGVGGPHVVDAFPFEPETECASASLDAPKQANARASGVAMPQSKGSSPKASVASSVKPPSVSTLETTSVASRRVGLVRERARAESSTQDQSETTVVTPEDASHMCTEDERPSACVLQERQHEQEQTAGTSPKTTTQEDVPNATDAPQQDAVQAIPVEEPCNPGDEHGMGRHRMMPDREYISMLHSFILLTVLFRLDVHVAVELAIQGYAAKRVGPSRVQSAATTKTHVTAATSVVTGSEAEQQQQQSEVEEVFVAAVRNLCTMAREHSVVFLDDPTSPVGGGLRRQRNPRSLEDRNARQRPEWVPIQAVVDAFFDCAALEPLAAIGISVACFTRLCLVEHEAQAFRFQHAFWAHKAFRGADINCDGFLSLDEFRGAVEPLGALLDEFDLLDVYERNLYDQGTTQLNFSGFHAATKTMWSTAPRPLLTMVENALGLTPAVGPSGL